jgi:hypothetical protein
MADANWKQGNTRPAIVIDLDLGVDPETSSPRTLVAGDVVTQIMKPPTGPSIVRTLTVISMPLNQLRYSPTAGDLDIVGDYEVEFDLTDSGGKVETVPDEASNNYEYTVDAILPRP